MLLNKLNRILLDPAPSDGGGTATLTTATPTPTGTIQSGPIPGAVPINSSLDDAINQDLAAQKANGNREPIITHDEDSISEPVQTDNGQPNADMEDADVDDYFNRITNKNLPKAEKKATPAPKQTTTSNPPPVEHAKQSTKEPSTLAPANDTKKDGKVNVHDLIFKKPSPTSEPTATKTNLPITRNYDGLPAEDVEAFKNMSKEAYARLRPIYDEHKAIKTELETLKKNPPANTTNKSSLPDSYLQHEEAYVLLPEYKQNIQEAERYDWEVSYWQKQLAQIEAGENWQPLGGFDEKSQKYSPGKTYKADGAAKAHVLAAMQRSINQREVADNNVNQIATLHQQVHSQSLQQLRDLEDKAFPFYREANNPHKEVISQMYERMPSIMRSSPFASFIAKGTAFVRALEDKIQELATENATLRASTQKQEVAKAGPTVTTSASNGPTSSQQEVSFEAFKALVGR